MLKFLQNLLLVKKEENKVLIKNRLILFIVAVTIFFIVFGGLFSLINISNIKNNQELISSQQNLLINLNSISSLLSNTESSQRDYLISGDPKYLSEFKKNSSSLSASINKLINLPSINPVQKENLARLSKKINERMEILNHGIYIRDHDGFDAVRDFISSDTGNYQAESIRQTIYRIQNQEYEILGEQQEETLAFYQKIYIGVVFVGIVSLIVIIFIYGTNLIERRRRKRIEFNKDSIVNLISQDIYRQISDSKILTGILEQKSKLVLDKEIKNIAERIKNQGEDALIKIKDLGDLFKIQTNKLIVHREVIDFNEFIKEVTSEIDNKFNIKLIAKSIPNGNILGDKEKLRRAFVSVFQFSVDKSERELEIEVKIVKDKFLIQITTKKLFENQKINGNPFEITPGEDFKNSVEFYIATEIIRLNKGRIWFDKSRKNLFLEIPVDVY
ncbi:MAG: CHASE3 domain-containing protein [Patescibacteria group bacterium]|nr:CHASE3 domain-containing protein [Patescibacteria group bacterium]